MAQCGNRMMEEHTRAAIPHYLRYLFAHRRLITVYAAFPARRLMLSKLTSVQTMMGIFFQSTAIRAHGLAPMMIPTIDGNHPDHRYFLTFNPVHRHF